MTRGNATARKLLVQLLLLGALVLLGPLAQVSTLAGAPSECTDSATVVFKRKSDLPEQVLKLIEKPGPMADIGEPFEKTDFVIGPPHPFRRFISADQSDCDLVINYEQGGRAYFRAHVLLRKIGNDWTIREGSSCPYC